jgi:hypothetical protein
VKRPWCSRASLCTPTPERPVRGYEQIKLDSIRGFRAAAAALERQLSEQADQVGR